MNRTAIAIVVVLILVSLSNLYGNYVVNVSNHYRKSNEPEWLKQILIGMHKDELIVILEDNDVSYAEIDASLDGSRRAYLGNIHSVCIDLKHGGLKGYPSEYMLAFEIHEHYSGETYSPFLDSSIEKKEFSNVSYLPLSITSTLVFGLLAWDNFAQSKDLTDIIESGNYSRETRKVRTRKRLIGWSSLVASIAGTVVSIQIIDDLNITATPENVKFTYNF